MTRRHGIREQQIKREESNTLIQESSPADNRGKVSVNIDLS